MDSTSLALLIFVSSFTVALIPHVFRRMDIIKKVYPFITIFTAGFLLGVMLLDFIPHMLEDNSDHKHDHKHDHDHDHDHDHEKGGCSHKHSINVGLLTSGVIFIFLIGVDNIILKHSHCENQEEINDHSKHEHDKFGTCNTEAIKYSTSLTQAFILVLALSLHSFFEGLGIKHDSTKYNVGIILHKIIESFTIGATLASAEKLRLLYTFVLILVYSSLTPLGIILVKFVKEYLNSPNLMKVCNGSALGSTLFIVCIEMIPPLFHVQAKPKKNILNVGFLTLGFMSTCAVMLIPN